MKKGIRLFTTLMVCVAMALCVSCKKDEKVEVRSVQAETPDVTTTANAADISGTYSYVSTMKSVVIVYGKDASLSSPQKATAEHTRDSYSVTINNLDPSTTYYYHCIFDTGYGASESEQWSFTTQATVTTAQVSDITQTTATCGGNVTSNGSVAVTARGVCWSTSQNPTVSNSHTTDGSGTGNFTSSITGLTENTTYYVRAYATNSAGTSYGEQKNFTTQTTPTVTTSSVSNITQTTATCGGNVTSNGSVAVTARGVCWSTLPNPTVSDSHTSDGTGTGSFTSSITGLTANTTYYVRAYATNSAGTSYGEQRTFTTQTTPMVTTSSVSNISQTTATCGGNVTSDGGATVTARGVCWSTSPNPTVSDSHTTDGTGTGSFTSSITGLTANTTYYVRAYATNSAGTSYGEQRTFTTQGGGTQTVPTVTTAQVSNITQTTATCGGEVTSDGGAAVTARGVCWSTSQNPTVSNSHTTDGSGTGSFTSSITGLTANTTYYVRAYATNSAGTSYGEQRTFTTQSGGGTQTVPTVTTVQVSNITQTTATCGGNVTSDGGAAVTARGVCWGTSQDPTVSNSHTTDGTGTGSFTSSITGLTANTTYYVRAYVTNSAGTSYGEQRTFTTQGGGGTQTTPTVTTSSVSNITQTTATCGGNVTSDGGATVTARGVCWSTSQNPTVSNSHTADGSGTGSFTSSITGLTANTTYYVRAYATNSAGTSYGEQKSFTTLQSISVPTVTTSSVSNITQTTATCGGSVTSDGGAAVTARGVCWSTSQNPTVSNSHTTNGSGIGSFTSSITGLTANTTYYVRAYATNSAGTSYGEQKSFTTLQSISVPTVTTSQVSNITQTTATCGGNVTSDGGATVTACGVCWSTSSNPTVSNSHTTDGSGTGSFTSSITGLTANTTYYVRAYATNSAGTSYGEQKSFTTSQSISVPTVTTSSVSNITQTTATCGGNVTSDGGAAVTVRGVCWSTSQNPTVSDSHTTDGSGTGSFTSSITGLTANTTYYVRAYATNSAGTSYGEQKSFTTQSGGGGGQTQAFTVNGVTFEMVAVEGGTFIMGGTPEQGSDAYDNEFPTHSVTLSDYCIGKFEVTQELWLAVMGSWPGTAPSVSCGLGDDYPAYYVSWNDCQEFITELNQLTGRTFRLPTEAEWEYAARGGNMSGGYKYSGSNSIGEVAWYYDNSGGKTHTVGTKSPNELGIYDMSGNVWEWCQDWYGSYSSGSQTDPQGPSSGSYRVRRGGSWYNSAWNCRVSNRLYSAPDDRSNNYGFRLVLVP